MGDSLLSGLEAFGLKDLEGISLYEEEKKVEKKEESKPEKKETTITEKDLLLDKTFKCPLCDHEFKNKIVKTGMARLIRSEKDLRPVYKDIDALKYDVISCPECGYTALLRFFPNLLQMQATRIREKISRTFQPKIIRSETYSYDDALDRYKLALINAAVKGAKPSEKGYICLKASWVARGKCEELGKDHADYAATVQVEEEFAKYAYEGFLAAYSTETFPMCGMDELTVSYILGALAIKAGDLDNARRFVSNVLNSRAAKERMKAMALELKQDIHNMSMSKG